MHFSSSVAAGEVSRISLQAAQGFIARVMPQLDPAPLSEIRCNFTQDQEWMRGGDGFQAWQRESVTVFRGEQVFKFAPLLGRWLATSIDQDRIHPSLKLIGT